ncbi:MAG: hypothetical protein DMF70_16255 [Acidobacteria bacterium]|nr:MAG: hypothetical protein DMF70_16255 [Acidobacteriota bacterium]
MSNPTGCSLNRSTLPPRFRRLLLLLGRLCRRRGFLLPLNLRLRTHLRLRLRTRLRLRLRTRLRLRRPHLWHLLRRGFSFLLSYHLGP